MNIYHVIDKRLSDLSKGVLFICGTYLDENKANARVDGCNKWAWDNISSLQLVSIGYNVNNYPYSVVIMNTVDEIKC